MPSSGGHRCTEVPALLVFLPKLPADPMLKSLIMLVLYKPHSGKASDVLGGCRTWEEAWNNHLAATRLKAESGDAGAVEVLQEIDQLMWEDYLAVKKRRWKETKQDLITINWISAIELSAPSIAQEYGFSLQSVCWGCGEQRELRACSRCHRARYCSKDCQKEAWWVHKNTQSEEWACQLT